MTDTKAEQRNAALANWRAVKQELRATGFFDHHGVGQKIMNAELNSKKYLRLGLNPMFMKLDLIGKKYGMIGSQQDRMLTLSAKLGRCLQKMALPAVPFDSLIARMNVIDRPVIERPTVLRASYPDILLQDDVHIIIALLQQIVQLLNNIDDSTDELNLFSPSVDAQLRKLRRKG